MEVNTSQMPTYFAPVTPKESSLKEQDLLPEDVVESSGPFGGSWEEGWLAEKKFERPQPLLCEVDSSKPVAHALESVACKWHMSLADLRLRDIPMVISEEELTCCLANLLCGWESVAFPNLSVIPGLVVSGVTSDALKALAKAFIPVGLSVKSLEKIGDLQQESCLTNKAFIEAILKYLSVYRASVQSLIKSCRILDFANRVQRLCRQIEFLAQLCNVGQNDTRPQIPAGIALLDYLCHWSHHIHVADLYHLLTYIITQSAGPYLRFLRRWLYHGKFEDSWCEFGVTFRQEYVERRDKTFWTNMFSTDNIITDPDTLFASFQDSMTTCGKTITLLKLCNSFAQFETLENSFVERSKAVKNKRLPISTTTKVKDEIPPKNKTLRGLLSRPEPKKEQEEVSVEDNNYNEDFELVKQSLMAHYKGLIDKSKKQEALSSWLYRRTLLRSQRFDKSAYFKQLDLSKNLSSMDKVKSCDDTTIVEKEAEKQEEKGKEKQEEKQVEKEKVPAKNTDHIKDLLTEAENEATVNASESVTKTEEQKVTEKVDAETAIESKETSVKKDKEVKCDTTKVVPDKVLKMVMPPEKSLKARVLTPIKQTVEDKSNLDLRRHCLQINNEGCQFFMKRLNLEGHLNAIRNYILFHNGEFGQALADALFASVIYDKLLTRKSRDLLETAIMNSSGAMKDPLIKNLTMQISDEKNPKDYLNTLTLSYKTEWPLNIILSTTELDDYSKLSSFLLKMKRATWEMGHVFMVLKGKRNSVIDVGAYYTVQLMRHEMFAFINALQSYTKSQIIDETWARLQKGLTSELLSIDCLIKLHSMYTRSMLFRSFLCKKAEPVQELIDCILMDVKAFTQEVLREKWMRGNLEDLQRIFQKFEKNRRFLIQVLTKLSERGYQHHLQELLLLINFKLSI